MPDKPWKAFEREVAKALGGQRVHRGGNFAETAPDVVLPEPELKIDCKWRRASFAHHTLLEEIRARYCEDGDVPVLCTRRYKRTGFCVTVPGEFFAVLLRAWRLVQMGMFKGDFDAD